MLPHWQVEPQSAPQVDDVSPHAGWHWPLPQTQG
jgi:hypothetical protein